MQTNSPKDTPQFDLILFGATSFVGQITCRYIVEKYADSDLKWAIAGRSQSKLDTLKQELKQPDLPSFVANADDQASIDTLAKQTKVIIATVGPYDLFGEPMVKACAENGTDYVDLTGEPQWIHAMLGKYEAIAQQTGARIVNCCGFDSIPSDLGVFFLQQHAQEQFGQSCTQVHTRVKSMKGAASGGTVASMLNVIKQATSNPKLRKLLANPYALCPQDHGFKAYQSNLSHAKFDEQSKSWMAPFIMASINTRIVHRTNALLSNQYGNHFLYDEAMLTGKGIKGSLMGWGLTAGLSGFMVGAVIPPTRWLLENTVLPKPGEGPSPSEQEKGFFDFRIYGHVDASSSAKPESSGKTMLVKVTGDRDPGYGSTAKMLTEAALCLSQDISHDDVKGGFWTPASAMGNKLIDRLQANAGLTFEAL
jgi:short subunit dehydrogenase-like uncharacterized protein